MVDSSALVQANASYCSKRLRDGHLTMALMHPPAKLASRPRRCVLAVDGLARVQEVVFN